MESLDFFSVFIIALGLSADCFAVAFGGSVCLPGVSLIPILRTALFFGAFQAIMPSLGWLLGRNLVNLIESFDHWIAFGLLALIGSKMIWEAFHEKEGEDNKTNITRGWPLLAVSVATSIDSLAAGLSFAFLNVNIITAVSTIGITAFCVTIISFYIGKKAGRFLGKWAEIAGGIILIGIGLRIIITHLLGA